MTLNIGIIDLGINNLFSISNAIKHLGYSPNVSSDRKVLENSECLIESLNSGCLIECL